MFLRHAFFPFLDVFDGAILLYAVYLRFSPDNCDGEAQENFSVTNMGGCLSTWVYVLQYACCNSK